MEATIEKDLTFLVLQYLDEENHKDLVHRLESKSGRYFDMQYFKKLATEGEFDEMEKYLCGFTKIEDNEQSGKIFYAIRVQKYLEALDKRDRAKALDIFRMDLKSFEHWFTDDTLKNMSHLLTMDDFRASPQFSIYTDTESARDALFLKLKELIEANPLFRDKLDFPRMETSRLRSLINQSLNWQHQQCQNPRPEPDFKSLFENHACFQPGPAGSNNPLKRPRLSETSQEADGKPRTSNVSGEGSTSSEVKVITEPSQCYSLRLPDDVTDTKVSRLIYTNSGSGVLALASNAEHKLWKWQKSDDSLDGKATAKAQPVLWTPESGIMMINVASDTNPEEAIPCLALTKSDAYLVSASGREISLFRMANFESMATRLPPPPAATFLAIHPEDYNIIGIGFADSSIKIFHFPSAEVIATLDGHENRITGLAFSQRLRILVSSSADSQLCIWSMDGWENTSSTRKPSGNSRPAVSDTRVQFHQNEIHLLVISEKKISICDAQTLAWLGKWVDKTGSRITSAAYSGDWQSIYVSLKDGAVNVINASNLSLRCRINQTAYLPSYPNLSVYPLVIAAHPSETNQFAVGLSNGHVYVIEPSESEGRWGTSPPDNF